MQQFPWAARRAASFISGQLDLEPLQLLELQNQKKTIAKQKQKIIGQVEKIESQKASLCKKNKRLETYKAKLSYYKNRIDLLKRKVESQKREIEGLAHILYCMPAPRDGAITAKPTAMSPSNGSSCPTGDFERDGYTGPVRVFTQAQCRQITAHLKERASPPPADWSKGRAVSDRFWYELGTRPALLSVLRSLMGKDIVLWGSTLVKRDPRQPHPWHTDIESSRTDGGFVSVWIGLENTCQQSGLQLVTRSHLFGKSIQEVYQEKGLSRGTASSENVVEWAGELDQRAEFLQPEVGDGEALIFDGRLWHGSYNALEQTRLALLFQYAKSGTPVRMHDTTRLEWPFRFLESPLPPVIVVSGEVDEVNRMVPPPPTDHACSVLFSGAHEIPMPLPEEKGKVWRSHHLFRGSTPILDSIGCHASILSPRNSPHLPHAHAEEELLIVLDGEADLIISDSAEVEGARLERVKQGDVVYYAPYQHHTIRNSGDKPVTYLMFKWHGELSGARRPLGAKLFHYDLVSDDEKPRWSRHLFKIATPYLGKLSSHVTVLQAGEGYEEHIDPYDIAILLLAGTVKTLGRIVGAPSVICYQAGEPHGITNVGEVPARYLVFEFRADYIRASNAGESTVSRHAHS